MPSSDLVLLVSRLVFAAIASFLAIVLWSRTRDSAWMLMVVGTIAAYADIIYSLLALFGAINPESLSLGGVHLGALVFSNLPYLFYSIAFIIMIVRKRLK